MPNVLIRDLSDDDLRRLDGQAEALGLSRVELLRREIQQIARRSIVRVEVSELAELARLTSDLDDDDVMNEAWR